MKSKKRVLVSPINWGLGHSTRCIPIIHALLKENFEVIIASEGRSLYLLRNEFPEIKSINMEGSKIKYYKNIPIVISMVLQIPKILFSIYKDHNYLRKIISEYKVDAVISDNRFGLWNKNIPSIFITHQLRIKSPFLEGLIQKINYFFINKFTECWIIDEDIENLAGDLSSPQNMPKRYKYIGIQSRLHIFDAEKKYDFLAIISGPEPQRTIFEKIILNHLSKRKSKSIVILGKTEENLNYTIGNCHIKSFAKSKEINKYIIESKIIFCRSGYSTIMDLSKLGAQAILIPTPGQTEQEYLAKYLDEKGICLSMPQKKFSINEGIKKNKNYSGFEIHESEKNWKELFSLF